MLSTHFAFVAMAILRPNKTAAESPRRPVHDRDVRSIQAAKIRDPLLAGRARLASARLKSRPALHGATVHAILNQPRQRGLWRGGQRPQGL